MQDQIVTLESGNVLSVPLSEEVANALDLHEGSQFAVQVEGRKIILRPLLADSLDKLRGSFSSDTDLVTELQQERRQDKW